MQAIGGPESKRRSAVGARRIPWAAIRLVYGTRTSGARPVRLVRLVRRVSCDAKTR